jgi:hypothetical protein
MSKTKQLEKLDGPSGIVWAVGDKVIVSDRLSEYVATITRITDGRGGTIYTKKINRENAPEIAYDTTGRGRGADIWNTKDIHPATQEDISRIKGKVARLQLSNFKWIQLSPDIAIEIRDYLRVKYNLEIH